MEKTANIFADIPGHLPEEIFSRIIENRNFRLERIVSQGHATPEGQWYDQEEDEWVMLLRGGAVIGFEDGRRVEMAPGDHLLIPAHSRHRVESTAAGEKTVWLALHFTHE